ncbi:MAG: tetratricopeptide repeat protein [Patescibacteria group bacterium]
MKDKYLLQSILNRVISIVIEGSVVFLLIAGAMSFEIWRNVLLPTNYPVDSKVINLVIGKAFYIAYTFALYLQVSKSLFFLTLKSLFKSFPEEEQNAKSIFVSYIIDVFVLTAVILATQPMRPVLQDTIASSKDFFITEYYVKYDAEPTVLILLYIGFFASMFIFFLQKNKYRIFKIMGIVAIIIIVGLMNNRPNFDARLMEAGAARQAQDYEKQIKLAKEALLLAETKDQKVWANYWIGVGYNKLGQPYEDIKYQKKVIELDPNFPHSYSSLAFAYSALGDYKNASQSAQMCIDRDPAAPWCYLSMFEYYLFDQQNIEKAEFYLHKAELLDPDERDFRAVRENFEKDKPIIEDANRRGLKVQHK